MLGNFLPLTPWFPCLCCKLGLRKQENCYLFLIYFLLMMVNRSYPLESAKICLQDYVFTSRHFKALLLVVEQGMIKQRKTGGVFFLIVCGIIYKKQRKYIKRWREKIVNVQITKASFLDCKYKDQDPAQHFLHSLSERISKHERES